MLVTSWSGSIRYTQFIDNLSKPLTTFLAGPRIHECGAARQTRDRHLRTLQATSLEFSGAVDEYEYSVLFHGEAYARVRTQRTVSCTV